MAINSANLIKLVEIVFVLAIVLVLGKFALVFAGGQAISPKPLAAPTPALVVTPKINADILTRFDPFNRDAKAVVALQDAADIAPETTLNLKVFGMRATGDGTGASAIIQTPDNKQASYYIDDEIISGVTLERVEIDYVILNRSGTLERLTREGKTKDGTSAIQVEIPSSTLSFKAADLVDDLRFFPRRQGREILGYQVRSRRGISIEKYGLKKSDIITSINGTDLTQLQVDLPGLFTNLKSARYASMQIIRDGNPMTIEVTLQ